MKLVSERFCCGKTLRTYQRVNRLVLLRYRCPGSTGRLLQILTNILHCDDGVKNLLDNMDKHFKKEMLDEAYDSYLEFSNYRRNDCVQVNEFLLEFESR